MKIKLLNGLSYFLWALLDSRWNLLVWVSLICCVFSLVNGFVSYSALQHNIPLNGVVAFFGNGSKSNRGSIPMEYLSTLIVYSFSGLFGGVVSALVWRTQNRSATPGP